jgi:uncharacterized protein (DUF488 family)
MKSTKGVALVAKNNNATIFTIGHSNKDINTFTDLLKTANIQTVIDCRTRPRSRFPQFNRERLATHLNSQQINYEFRGTNLGGYGGNVFFNETLDELKDRAERNERIALLCSEGKPQDCHRGTILAPELQERGLTIEHLVYTT